MDTAESVIEFIYAHHYMYNHNRAVKKKQHFDFHVRWLNQPPSEDKWLSYNELQDTEALDIYLRQHPELHF